MYKLKLDDGIVEQLGEAEQIDIFLLKPEVAANDISKSAICSHVFLKTESALFRIEGIVEDFGIKRDEIFALVIKKGWVNFKCLEEERKRTLVFGEEYFSFPNNLTQLTHFYSLQDKGHIKVQIHSDQQEIYDIRTKIAYPVDVDDAILFRDEKKEIYIRQHSFPYSVLITQNEVTI